MRGLELLDDAVCGALTFGDRVDHFTASAGAIAGGKVLGIVGGARHGIGGDAAIDDSDAVAEHGSELRLAERDDDHIAADDKVCTLDDLERAGFGAGEFDALDAFFTDNADGADVPLETDAEGFGV